MQNDDKRIEYLPPEWGKKITVNFYNNLPTSISSNSLQNTSKALIVFDATLPKHYLNLVENLIAPFKLHVEVMPLNPDGKSLEKVDSIWTKMIEVHPDIAIALGGGTICDMVGFASSCFHRGTSHIFFPTTLLSMVDACIGGKTGIDYLDIKNSIGKIHYAEESFCIFPFLKTLEHSELISGFSEVIKAGMLFENELITKIESLRSVFHLNEQWFSVVCRGAELKAAMSEKPLAERSRLLYGHNIGHALETSAKTHKRHGDCVSIGMNVELALGLVAGIVAEEVWIRQRNLLHKFNLPIDLPRGVSYEHLKEKMKRYKLYKQDMYLFVVPKKPGTIIEMNESYYWKVSERELDYLWPQAMNLMNKVD